MKIFHHLQNILAQNGDIKYSWCGHTFLALLLLEIDVRLIKKMPLRRKSLRETLRGAVFWHYVSTSNAVWVAVWFQYSPALRLISLIDKGAPRIPKGSEVLRRCLMVSSGKMAAVFWIKIQVFTVYLKKRFCVLKIFKDNWMIGL